VNTPDRVGVIDRINENGDSCDVYGNMLLDAKLISFGSRLYAPSSSSPAIDAASGDLPDDPDYSPADIGYWTYDHEDSPPALIFFEKPDGGGTSTWIDTMQVFANRGQWLVYEVKIEDIDTDTMYYQWTARDVVFGTGMITEEYYGIDFTDSVQFLDDGEYFVKLLVTDGNELQQIVCIVTVGHSGVEFEEGNPLEFSLHTPFPNPFNQFTSIEYNIPSLSDVTFRLYDITGRMVSENFQHSVPVGKHRYFLEAGALPSGKYFLRVEAGEFTGFKTVVLIR
jgi:hypothetical protein